MKTKIVMAGCFLLFGAMALEAQGPNAFKAENGKYGFKHKDGKVVIAPKYDFASFDFRDGLAKVGLGGQYGFVDETGREVIPLQYKTAYDFSEGLAAVQNDSGWLYIDKAGKTALSLPGYINVSGLTVFSDAMMFSEGLAPIQIRLMPYERIYNDVTRPDVRARLARELGLTEPFTEKDRAKIEAYFKPIINQTLLDPYRYTYIDKNGDFLIDPFKGYHTARRFREGMAVVGMYVPGHSYTTMNPKYTFGHMDKTGKLVVPLKYEDARSFSEGLAAVKAKGLWGFVNKEGREVVPPQIGWAGEFKRGYALVAHGKITPGKEFNAYEKGSVWGIIGKDGRAVVPITNYRVHLDEDGTVTAVNGSLEAKAHISAYEDFNKGTAALQQRQYEQAAAHFRQSADKGFGGAMCNLGSMHITGSGVEKSLENGLEWMKKGAARNDLHSMLNLGLHHMQNQPQNFDEAFKWFKLAGDNGYASAMGHLALLYAAGRGVAQSGAEAKKWLDEGVGLDDSHCMFNYGLLHAQGVPGFARDGNLARQWFQKAARAGHPQARQALAELGNMGL